MKAKKINIMSLSIDVEMQGRLKRAAERRNTSVSKFVRDMVNKFVGPDPEEVFDTVILRVPADLRGNPEQITNWLQAREPGIVKALTQ